MTQKDTNYPKIRPVDPMPVIQNDQHGILLRDPLQLAPKVIIVPEGILPLLALLDGTRENANAISAALAIRYGVEVPANIVQQLVEVLDDTFLLENESYRAAAEKAVEEFHSLPYREPAHAGASYPEDPDALRELLDNYMSLTADVKPVTNMVPLAGIVSPHIDFERGGQVYAEVWKRASNLVRNADLAVILGTDHYGQESITLTLQNYATPFGVLRTARGVAQTIAQAIGDGHAFAGELRHRTEHSIELAAVWLQYIRGGMPIENVPILCGSFRRFTQDGASPEDDMLITALVRAFRQATVGRRVIIVAAGDLAHIGPAFDGEPVDLDSRVLLRHADSELLSLISTGDADGFLQAIKRVRDKNNVCGLPPIYLMLKLLGPIQGSSVGYDQCPADEAGTSVVSIGGAILAEATMHNA